MNALLRSLVLSLASAPLLAQQAAEPTQARPPVVDLDQMTLEYVGAPDGLDRSSLDAILQLYRRNIYVKGKDGSVTGPVKDLEDSRAGYFVYDAVDYVALVKAAVGKAAAAMPRNVEAPLRIATYVPHYVDVSQLAAAIEPLRRNVLVPAAPGLSAEDQPNVSFHTKPSLILVQDTTDQVDRILELLAQVDQPPAQFMVQCLVLATSLSDNATDAALPADLIDNLRRLLPYRSYPTLATALIRASIEPGEEQTLVGQMSTGSNFKLSLLPGGVDLARRQVSLQRLRFQADDQSFETSAVISLDEYAVIGAAGSNPFLVVLRVTSLAK